MAPVSYAMGIRAEPFIVEQREVFFMTQTITNSDAPVTVRERQIGNTTFIVKSFSRDSDKNKILSKIERLIKNDIAKDFS